MVSFFFLQMAENKENRDTTGSSNEEHKTEENKNDASEDKKENKQ